MFKKIIPCCMDCGYIDTDKRLAITHKCVAQGFKKTEDAYGTKECYVLYKESRSYNLKETK